MTTKATVSACVSAEKEVKVTITDLFTDNEEYTLQDGEVVDFYVYDNRTIEIKEIEK